MLYSNKRYSRVLDAQESAALLHHQRLSDASVLFQLLCFRVNHKDRTATSFPLDTPNNPSIHVFLPIQFDAFCATATFLHSEIWLRKN